MKHRKSAVMLGFALVVSSAQAIPTLTSANADWSGIWGANQNASDLETIIGLAAGTLTEVYKQNVGGTEEKAFAASYATTFDSLLDAADATITYDGAPDPVITGGRIFVYAKDGTPRPHYVWEITGWNGTDTISIQDLYLTGGGSISHVSIFATAGTTNVPEGGATIALLGLALASLGLMSHRILRA